MNLFANESFTASILGFTVIFGVAALGIVGLYFWIVMLLDAVTRKSKTYGGAKKLLWILCILAFDLIGALIYWIRYKPEVANRKTISRASMVLAGVFVIMVVTSLAISVVLD